MRTNDIDQDRAWIAAIRQGSREAFEAMVRAYYPGLFDFACALTRRPDTAEDLVQEILLQVWLHRDRWEPEGSARAYLFRAVRNRAINLHRDETRHRTASLDAALEIAAPDPEPDAELSYQDLLQAVNAAIAELPERRKEVYRLGRLYGLTYEQIAEALGISINTVRTQMTAALTYLRERLSRHAS